MDFNLDFISANAIVIVPIILALVQAMKLTGWIPDHFAPLLSIGFGVIVGFLADHDNPNLAVTILSGAVYGLMASGLYSGVKVTMQAHQQQKIKKQQQDQKKRNNQ